MSEHEHQEQSRSPRKKKKARGPLLLIIALLIAAAGAGVYMFLRPEGAGVQDQGSRRETRPGPSAAPTAPAVPATAQGVPGGAPIPATGETTAPAGGQTQPAASGPMGPCTATAQKLHEFFLYLDRQEYLGPFALNSPSQAYFIALAEKLLAKPPVVTRETDDLYTILQNTAHFFRVVGKDNIRLITTILDREQDRIEAVAGDLYQWLTLEGCREEILPFSPPLDKVYEYAGFFLNTMGGRAYLFRRDSRTRLLVTYYSILIVDQANARGGNRYGIDIRQPVRQLMQEIESSTQLARKESYLDRLYKIQESLPPMAPAAE